MFHLGRRRANHLSSHRAGARKKLLIGLGLELGNSLSDNGVSNATGAPKRGISAFILNAQKLKALSIGILPLLAAALIIFIVSGKLRRYVHEDALIQNIRKVGVRFSLKLFGDHVLKT